jgi:hypothetical protein
MDLVAFGLLRSTLVRDATPEQKADRRKLLKLLVTEELVLKLEDPEDSPGALHLLRNNILFFNGKSITPQHASFGRAIREYVNMYCQ